MVVVVAAGNDGRLTEFHHHEADYFFVDSTGILVVGKKSREAEGEAHYHDWASVRHRDGRGAIEAYRTPPLRIEAR